MKSLIPWRKAKREMNHYRRNRDDLFDRFFSMPMHFDRRLFAEDNWYPSLDVSEGKKDIIVKESSGDYSAIYIDAEINDSVGMGTPKVTKFVESRDRLVNSL